MDAKDKLIQVTEIIEWLNDARKEYGQNWIKQKYELDKVRTKADEEKVLLVHWIVYLNNRQQSVETVFGNIKIKVEKFLVDNYLNGRSSDYISNINKIGFGGRTKGKDVESVKRTLIILDLKYNRSIINFFKEFIGEFKSEKNGLRRIAHVADLLSYRPYETPNKRNNKLDNEHNIQETLNLFGDKERLKNDYNSKEKNDYFLGNSKRLWCVVRDFKDPAFGRILVNRFRSKELKKKWLRKNDHNFSVTQLELPGDTWNEDFSKHFLIPLAEDIDRIKEKVFPNKETLMEKWSDYIAYKNTREGFRKGEINKSKKSPFFAKALYNAQRSLLKQERKKSTFHPEKFDVSMDLASRMCSVDPPKCEHCLFRNGAKKICHKGKAHYCSVIFGSLGYLSKCDTNKCPINNKVIRDLCRGGKNKKRRR